MGAVAVRSPAGARRSRGWELSLPARSGMMEESAKERGVERLRYRMRVLFGLVVMGALASCGGPATRAPSGLQFAQGPISEACERSGRKAASRQLCGCIQAVANAELSGADQRRGAGFFGNPERAQDVRLNDSASADAFWARWTDFAATAERRCQAAA